MQDMWYWIIGIALLVGLYLLGRNWRGEEAPSEPEAVWWEGIFTRQQWENFFQLIKNYFDTRSIRFEIDPLIGVIRLEKSQQLGLINIAQQCAQAQHLLWPKMIAKHFDNLLSTGAISNQELLDYSQAAPLLAIRIWPEEILKMIGMENLVYRQNLPGTISVLVLDFPNSVQTVKADIAARWNVDLETLFKQAEENTRQGLAYQIERQEIGEGINAWIFSSDSIYATGGALWLENYPQCLGPHGALVAIPNRHYIVCYPIIDQQLLPALNLLIPFVYTMALKGPGTVTEKLYWYSKGAYTELPYKIKNQKIDFAPPESFVRMVEILSQSSQQTPEIDQSGRTRYG